MYQKQQTLTQMKVVSKTSETKTVVKKENSKKKKKSIANKNQEKPKSNCLLKYLGITNIHLHTLNQDMNKILVKNIYYNLDFIDNYYLLPPTNHQKKIIRILFQLLDKKNHSSANKACDVVFSPCIWLNCLAYSDKFRQNLLDRSKYDNKYSLVLCVKRLNPNTQRFGYSKMEPYYRDALRRCDTMVFQDSILYYLFIKR